MTAKTDERFTLIPFGAINRFHGANFRIISISEIQISEKQI